MKASLRKRLSLILLGLTLFAWISSAVVTFFYGNRVMQQQLDQQLRQYSDLLTYITLVFARQIDEGVPQTEAWLEPDLQQASRQPMVVEGPQASGLTPAVNIWYGDKLIAVFADSPRFEVPVEEGFSYGSPAGDEREWRLLTRYDAPNDLWIRVGVERSAARWAMLGTLGSALLPLLIVLPLTLLVLYLGVAGGLQPLRHLAAQISHRQPAALDPVATEDVPKEVAGVVDALNDLFARLAVAMEGEQRFTANAAHELMTPLAAIKTEVQLCQRQLREEPGAGMLVRIAQRVDRASHTVEQLLTLARVDPDSALVMEPVALRRLLVEVVAETAHLASERGLQVELIEGPECEVAGSHEPLAILLRNLLVNAFRYASDETVVRISLAGSAPVTLEICNDCEPLSAAEFDHLADRFYRVPGSKGQGAGLGLSIVTRIAELHQAQFIARPRSDGSGFCAQLSFPHSLGDGRPG